MSGRFDGQVAVVTGAAAGIGLAVARRLTADGAQVVLVDRDKDHLAEAAAELSPAAAVEADVTLEADVEAYVRKAVDTCGHIDLFANNAGIEGELAPIVDQTVENFDRVMAVNARGVFLGLREVLRVMTTAGRGGAIVNTASQAGIKGGPNFSPYIASKHAVVGLTKTAAGEVGRYGIRVNAVAPGLIETGMLQRLGEKGRQLAARAGDDAGARRGAGAFQIPLGHQGTPEEVASLITWLLSEDASHVTGSIVLVDGGINA
jgi:NAD(P)-dependent dehydrogenase (short-subunit alcohol dehydrogenase family)